MVDYIKALIDLLATTEGRDKLLKGLGAGMRVVAEQSGQKHHKAMAASVSEARSILRLVSVSGNIVKVRDLVAAGSFAPLDVAMILRIIGDGVYSVNDNIAYLGKYLKWDAKTISSAIDRSFVGMFWGFFLAVVIDIVTLLTMNLSDRVKLRARVLLLVRNVCDMFAALHNVKYIKAFSLTGTQVGTLGVISAAVSTFENWEKATAKQLKSA